MSRGSGLLLVLARELKLVCSSLRVRAMVVRLLPAASSWFELDLDHLAPPA